MAKYVFPAVFEPEDGGYNVTFPDLPDCYTCGDDAEHAVYMATDVLNFYLSDEETDGHEIPSPRSIKAVKAPEGGFVSAILADTAEYRRKLSQKAVKKTLSIPSWLNDAAEAANVNFSQTLQNALRAQLGL